MTALAKDVATVGSELAIRHATRADLQPILELFSEDEFHSRLDAVDGPVDEVYVRALETIHASPNNAVYVAELGRRVVGTFQLTFIQQLSYRGACVAQVESVSVASELRSHGIGTAMMRYAIEAARRNHCVRLQLTSNVQRTRAHSFYERLGFETTHRGMKLYLR